ncbi:LCP family protein [Kitasatospora sp. NPDC008050]|uniref:LCP family protein n=1 Tax=Kitasatospora sp. NPDC008050 TaxID=3364021 RepID=UPI0036E7BA72
MLAAVAGALVYHRLSGNLTSFDAAGLSTDRPTAASADAEGRMPVNVLLIGSDARGGDNSAFGGGEAGGARSDTTILLHVYADHRRAVGVSIPRDSLVDIPSCRLPDGDWTAPRTGVMFNSAFSVGGSEQGNPACAQNTVEKLTGLRIDHTIVVDFQGFAAVTGAVGGVEVCLPKAVHESDLNPNLGRLGEEIFARGKQRVSGKRALDYVRLRHGLGDGSDIGRTKRQQAFLAALIKEVKGRGLDPTALLPLADAATKSLTVDAGLNSPQKLVSFAASLKDIDLHETKFLTAPWRYQGPRVALVQPDTDQLWAALKADRALDGEPQSGERQSAGPPAGGTPQGDSRSAVDGTGIQVGVYNATRTPGLAGRAAALLESSHFTVTNRANAATTGRATTVVEHGPGERAEAESAAALFPGATLESGATPGLRILLGADCAAALGRDAEAPGAAPAPVPPSVSEAIRSADDDPCGDVSFG